MLFQEADQSHKRRSAAFDARMADARTFKTAAADMAALAAGEPTPSDVMALHDSVVSPDLRASIVEARKRMWMMSPADRLAYRETISPLADAIDDLVARLGPRFNGLKRFISPSAMPKSSTDRVIENHQLSAKLAKVADPTHVSDLTYLVDPRVPPALRRQIIDVKKALDAATPDRRRTLLRMVPAELLSRVNSLRRIIGTEGVDALRRVLAT